MRKYTYVVVLSILNAISVGGQSTIDFSKNETQKHIRIQGTNLSLDTTGLNLNGSANPRVFMNDSDQTIFSVEQKQLSIEDYTSFIEMQLKFDSIILEKNVVFNAYKGKLFLGEINIQDVDKDVWICYLGNQDYVIEIKGFYNSALRSTYRSSFEKVIKSLFVDSHRSFSIYEDLPFYLDENHFPYKKEMSFMPESIALSQEVDGYHRTVTLMHLTTSPEEIEELKKEYEGNTENYTIAEKEITTIVKKMDDRIALEGIIVFGHRVIMLNCISSLEDENAISEFKDIAKSVEFK